MVGGQRVRHGHLESGRVLHRQSYPSEPASPTPATPHTHKSKSSTKHTVPSHFGLSSSQGKEGGFHTPPPGGTFRTLLAEKPRRKRPHTVGFRDGKRPKESCRPDAGSAWERGTVWGESLWDGALHWGNGML